jgi:hypothetical protein
MKKASVFTLLALLPSMAFAQGAGLTALIVQLQTWLDLLIPLLLTAAIVVFFWGLVKYILNAGDEAAKESGKTLMIWGMIALFVMVAFWGIIGWVQQSLGLSDSVTVVTAPPINPVPIAP